MPQNLKKLKGHIALGLYVRPSVLMNGPLLGTLNFQNHLRNNRERSGRVLDSRSRGCRFEPHKRH